MNAMKLTRSRFVLLLAAAGIVAMVAGPALAGRQHRGNNCCARRTTSWGQRDARVTVVYVVTRGYATSGGSRLVFVQPQPQPWRRGSVIFGRTSRFGRNAATSRSRRSHTYRSRRRGHYSNRRSHQRSGRSGLGLRFTIGF